jgi:putative oxidoreductase
MKSPTLRRFCWALQIIAAVILGQTLFFKFTGAPESIHIFTTLGQEPAGRIGSGVAELIAVILLFTPRLAWAGASLGLGVMSGAIFFHLTKLGLVVLEDGGLLFALAVTTWICCATVLLLRRRELPWLGSRLRQEP